MFSVLDNLIPTVPPFSGEAIAQTATETKATTAPPPSPDVGQPLLVGSGFVVGGAVMWAAIAKLIEKYGSTTIEARQQKTSQELAQARSVSEFYLKEADRDSKTINETLNLFVTKHLDSTTQIFDLYYALLEEYKSLREETKIKNERIASIESLLKDIIAVLNIKERQNKL